MAKGWRQGEVAKPMAAVIIGIWMVGPFFFFFSRKLFMFSKSVTVFDLLKKNGVKCFCLFAVIFR